MNSELSIQELELVAGDTYLQPSISSANSSPFAIGAFALPLTTTVPEV